LSLSSIALTGVTIKKLNDFHYKMSVSVNENERKGGVARWARILTEPNAMVKLLWIVEAKLLLQPQGPNKVLRLKGDLFT